MSDLLPEYHKREKFYPQPDGCIIATTSKAGCTTVKLGTPGGIQDRMMIDEALRRRKKGTEVILYLRHPYHRMVSAWKYFTREGRFLPRTYMTDEEEQIINNAPSFPGWLSVASKYNDEHWTGQVDYHTLDGEFVPSRVIALTFMSDRFNRHENHQPYDYMPSHPSRAEHLTYMKQTFPGFEKDLGIYTKITEPARPGGLSAEELGL